MQSSDTSIYSWSETDEDWVERKKKVDNDDEDESEAAKRILLQVRHRVMPKSPNSEGYTIVQFKHSEHIVDTLRGIIKDSEDLFEDKASIDAKELFLAKSEVVKVLDKLKEEKEVRKAEADVKETQETDESNPESKGTSNNTTDREVKSSSIDMAKDEAEDIKEDAKDNGNENNDEALTTSDGRPKSADRNVTAEKDDDDEDDEKKEEKLSYSELSEKVEHLQVLVDFITEYFAHSKPPLLGKLSLLTIAFQPKPNSTASFQRV